jgi:NADPH:quinone reductase-like Zn-dependent oxidoreductase/acyl carrier protein/ubiquinone/menaquinone biosynthesis C-methylase UbiE
MELVEGIYKNNPIADYFNEILAETAAAYTRERLKKDPSAGMRILEIGAGTGGTSAIVFSKFQPYRDQIQEYCYTDISKAFLMHAGKEYGQKNPYLTYKIFNVEKPIAGQGISAGGYDLVIAANVLHATKNIRHTLRNAKAALKDNGLILLNEISSNTLFTHLTFGLLEGWWLYEDPALRIPGCPGLSPKTWQSVLESEGFRRVFFPAQDAHDLGQQVIAAESDGVVRQKQHLKTVIQTRLPVAAGKKINSKPVNHEAEPHPETMKIATESSSLNHSPGSDVTDRMVEDHVKTIIRESLAGVLQIEEGLIHDDQSFSEFGVDSIIAVNLVNLISRECNITLPTTVLFDYQNVDQLMRHIIQEHKAALISSLQENVSEAIPVVQEKRDYTYHRINRREQKNRFYPAAPSNREVRMVVKSFSLNFGELPPGKGLNPAGPGYPLSPGFGISGTVLETGRDVTRVKTGDEVIGLTDKNLDWQNSIVNIDERLIDRKPENVTFEEACTLPVDFITIYYAFEHTDTQPGKKILILTPSVNVGLMAVHLASLKGVDIYVSVDSQEKSDYLREMGVKHPLNYLEGDFEKRFLELTNNIKVDIIISAFDKVIPKIINVLAPGGKHIEIK